MGDLITISTTGISIQTYEEILEDFKAAIRADVDPAFNLEADSFEGQVIAIAAAKLRDVGEAVLELATAIDPENADDALLDSVCALTGTIRQAATKGRVVVTLTASGAWSVTSEGELVAQVSGYPDRLFQNAGALSGGAGNTDVTLVAVSAGYFEAPASTVTVKITGPAAITAITNALAASPGSDAQTDPELRIARRRELVATGSSHIDGVRAAIEALDGVVKATVVENNTMITNSDGIPAKAIECIVDDRGTVADADIAQTIFDAAAAGIEVYGTTDSGTATDDEGSTHTVEFTRPTVVDIHIAMTVKGGDSDAIKAAIVAEGAIYGAGDDVEALMLVGAASRVPGVTGITTYKVDTVDPPVASVNVAIGVRQRANIETANIDITVV